MAEKKDDSTKPKSKVTSTTKKGLATDTTTRGVEFEAGTKDIDREAITEKVTLPQHAGARQAQASAINALTYGSPFADMSLPGGAFAPTAEARQIAGGMVGGAIPTAQQAQAGGAPQLFGKGGGITAADPTDIDYGPQARTEGEKNFWNAWATEQQDYLKTLPGGQLTEMNWVAPQGSIGTAETFSNLAAIGEGLGNLAGTDFSALAGKGGGAPPPPAPPSYGPTGGALGNLAAAAQMGQPPPPLPDPTEAQRRALSSLGGLGALGGRGRR